MRHALVALVLAAPLTVPPAAWAGAERAGTTAANFLSVGVGTGILGMGGATIGLGGHLDATPWNAAALGWLSETQVAFSHAGLSEDTAQEWLVAGGRFGRSGTRWSLSGLYQSEGEFEGRDASNNPTGGVKVASLAAGAHLAQAFGRHVSVGVGAKWVDENLGVVRGSGVAVDAGLQVRAGIVGFGVAAQNAFGNVTFDGTRYPMPANYGAGVAIDHPSGVRAALDVNLPDAYYTDVRGGVEWRWKDRVALRTGYRAEMGAPADEALSGPSFGFGVGAYRMWLDYGYLIANHGDATHRLGFSFNPSKIPIGAADPFGQNEMPREFEGPKQGGAQKQDAGKKAGGKTASH